MGSLNDRKRSSSAHPRPAALPLLALFSAASATAGCTAESAPPRQAEPAFALPAPRATGAVSIEEVLARRRSVRQFKAEPLPIEDMGQLLWAAQGITDAPSGHRASPSAGALYPLEAYAVTPDGVYHYLPRGHRVERVLAGDRRKALSGAALGQEAVERAAVDFVLAGVVSRTSVKYGDRAERYVALEAGHAAQNILLQATALGLGAVPIGAVDDRAVRAVLSLPAEEQPLYLIAVGRPAP